METINILLGFYIIYIRIHSVMIIVSNKERTGYKKFVLFMGLLFFILHIIALTSK